MLYKRHLREFKRNFGIYFAIFLIISIGLGTVLGGNAGDDSMIAAVEDFFQEANLSDGYATMLAPLTDDQLDQLEAEGISLEAAPYLDLDTDDGEVRIFKRREDINREYLWEGSLPEEKDEVFLEKHYCQANGYNLSDSIEIGEQKYKIGGIGCLPDYIYVLKKSSDMSSHTDSFSVAVIGDEAFEEIMKEPEYLGKITWQYNFLCGKEKDIDQVKKLFEDISDNQLIEFVNSQVDSRVVTYKEDCAMVKRATFIFSLILLVVIAYVMSVFLKDRVEKESLLIGTISALGYRKRELILHYLELPIITSFMGGIGALLCGYGIFSKMLTQDSVDLYSMPDFRVSMPAYIIVFGLTVPVLIMGVIGFFMLSRKIEDCPEKIMKPERKAHKSSLKLNKVSYINAFRIRQFFKEISGNLVMIGGIFLAAVLLLLGISIYSSVNYYKDHAVDDISYKYMYFVASDQDLLEGAEPVSLWNMKCESGVQGMDLTVSLHGVKADSSYFNEPAQAIKSQASRDQEEAEKQEDKVYPVVISDSVAQKCGLKKGDSWSICDQAKTNMYQLRVSEIVAYSNGLSVFMDQESLNEMLSKDKDSYNGVVSERDLSGEAFDYLSCVKNSEYKEAAESTLDSLMLIIIALLGSAAVVFVMVIYLMMKFMTDKAKGNIALLKILGYRGKEVNRIYLGGESYVVILSIIISLPLGTAVINLIFPYLTAGYSVYLIPSITLEGYLLLGAFMLVTYYLVYFYLKKRIKKIDFVEILKNRE